MKRQPRVNFLICPGHTLQRHKNFIGRNVTLFYVFKIDRCSCYRRGKFYTYYPMTVNGGVQSNISLISRVLKTQGPGGSMSQVVGLPNNSYKPITNTAWVRARFYKLQKGCTRLAVVSEKAYQLLAHSRWFSPGTTASSTTKTGRHDIAEILLKVALHTKNKII